MPLPFRLYFRHFLSAFDADYAAAFMPRRFMPLLPYYFRCLRRRGIETN